MKAVERKEKIGATNNSTRTTYGSVEEFAREVGISRQSAYAGLRNGSIPAIRIGRRFVLPKSAIAEWLKNAGR